MTVNLSELFKFKIGDFAAHSCSQVINRPVKFRVIERHIIERAGGLEALYLVCHFVDGCLETSTVRELELAPFPDTAVQG
jgi:hypothetical protein